MIISASRRTDIPAYFSKWFINRIRAGYCLVANPFNSKQVTEVSLLPADVDVIIFWTRNPAPLFPHLDELDDRGFRYYFQYTILGYPREIDRHGSRLAYSLERFCRLADRIGVGKVIWRYDPILLTERTGLAYHLEQFERIAEALRGCSQSAVISLYDEYAGHRLRMRRVEEQGYRLLDERSISEGERRRFFTTLASIARSNGMTLFSCAEPADLEGYGIRKGACIDAGYIERTFGIKVSDKKDPHQREACRCCVSKDIGAYGTCLMGCAYCYATPDFQRAVAQYQKHNPLNPSMI